MKLEDVKGWHNLYKYMDEHHPIEMAKQFFWDDIIHQYNDYSLKYHAKKEKRPQRIEHSFKDLKQYIKDEGWKKK